MSNWRRRTFLRGFRHNSWKSPWKALKVGQIQRIAVSTWPYSGRVPTMAALELVDRWSSGPGTSYYAPPPCGDVPCRKVGIARLSLWNPKRGAFKGKSFCVSSACVSPRMQIKAGLFPFFVPSELFSAGHFRFTAAINKVLRSSVHIDGCFYWFSNFNSCSLLCATHTGKFKISSSSITLVNYQLGTQRRFHDYLFMKVILGYFVMQSVSHLW